MKHVQTLETKRSNKSGTKEITSKLSKQSLEKRTTIDGKQNYKKQRK